jgi:hypothetical protein
MVTINKSSLKPPQKPYLDEEYLRQLARSLERIVDALSELNTAILDSKNAVVPVSLADASANNNSIYYSTTQTKLVYKDGGGVVRVLY